MRHSIFYIHVKTGASSFALISNIFFANSLGKSVGHSQFSEPEEKRANFYVQPKTRVICSHNSLNGFI